LQVQIEELELTEHVRLLGFVSDQQLGLAYRAADFSVVPTVALEGLDQSSSSRWLLAHSSGNTSGGIPEIPRPFSEDLVLEGSTADQLAQGILEALSGQRKLPSSQECEATSGRIILGR